MGSTKPEVWSDVRRFHEAAAALAKSAEEPQRRALYDEMAAERPGDVFVRSEQWKSWQERFPSGAPSHGEFRSDPVPLPGGMRTLITSADASAGALVRPEQRGMIEPGLFRPNTVLDLITKLSVTSDTVEFAKEAAHTSAAAPVAESSALTGTSGTKPEGSLSFELISVAIKQFAVWLPATRRILSDASQLAGLINSYLAADLRRAVGDDVLSGDGSGEHFLGVLNASGVQTQTGPGAGETAFDALRRARTKVEVNARTVPTAVALHPSDNESLDLLKKTANLPDFVADPYSAAQPPLWGMARVVSDVVPAGTAIVADWSKAVLFDRNDTNISLGTISDQFIRNQLSVLAEGRAGFALIRPSAFVLVTLT